MVKQSVFVYFLFILCLIQYDFLHADVVKETDKVCQQVVHTAFIPMTCGQNLYTQYHKLLFLDDFCDDNNYEYSPCMNVDFSVTYRYVQSHNGSNIAKFLWNADTLIFQGYEAVNRLDKSLIAEYFGMGPDTNMGVTLSPVLKNQVIDLQLVFSGEKAWFQMNVPLMWAKWYSNKKCGEPQLTGGLGVHPIDGIDVSLKYVINPSVSATAGNIFINNVSLQNESDGYVWFDNAGGGSSDVSFIGKIASQEALPKISTDNVSVSMINDISTNYVLLPGGRDPSYNSQLNHQSVYMGIIPFGMYTTYQSDANFLDVGEISLQITTDNVFAVNDFGVAMGKGYPFGFFAGRSNNNFDFFPCTKFNIADLPMMFGYDFCKSDDYHLGLYIKCVLPTGTKIDESFLNYVLTPVIGNGRHFELGIGASGHINFLVCDYSAHGIFCDGYIDKLFGAWQTRVFDLPNQPMSRYALAIPITGNDYSGYVLQNNTIVSIGDVNTRSGNVDACRGEFILDWVYMYKNFKMGLGYGFTGQTEEKMSCGSCGKNPISTIKDATGMNLIIAGYGVLGKALQFQMGVTVGPNGSDVNSVRINNNYVSDITTVNAYMNFFDLGQTGEVAEIPSGASAAYDYGIPTVVDTSIIYKNDNIDDNRSGLMNGQILNRLFGHFDYIWQDHEWQPECGVIFSIGFSPMKYLTAAYWDIGGRIGCVF